jgi:polysaccharide pyruvyl transferase WcaK-like protein
MINRNDPLPTCIALYGIGGVYNYGCEAIIKGTGILLRERWPDVRLLYLSSQPEDDARRLRDSSIEVLPRRWYPRYHWRKLAAKGARMLRLHWRPRTEALAVFTEADAILSIGGDMYTVGYEPGRYPQWLVDSGELALRRKRPFIIWGASIGPFEANVQAKRVITAHLKRVSLITAREPETIEYLATLGITTNVIPCADPAFAINRAVPRASTSSQGIRIGVNYSPLSLAYAGTGGDASKQLEGQATTLVELARQFDAELVLIPHVVSDAEAVDDDRRYADRLCALLSGRVSHAVRLVHDDPGFCGLRDTLLSCDFVIAARMHCAINAISLGVPAILAAYSQKAIGMARYVYGHERWVIPLAATIDGNLLIKARELLAERQQVHEQLMQRLPTIQTDARKAVTALQALFSH